MKDAKKCAGGAGIDLQDIYKIITKSNQTKFVATSASLDDKRKLMLAKRNLKVDGKAIFVDDDLTPAEQSIQYKARLFAKEERKTVEKAWIDGHTYVTNTMTNQRPFGRT